MPNPERSYQLHFGEDKELPKEVYYFHEGVIIYPANSGRGVLRKPINAKRLDAKIKGLTGFIAHERIDLYFNGRYWSLPEGTIFGAYVKKASKRQIR